MILRMKPTTITGVIKSLCFATQMLTVWVSWFSDVSKKLSGMKNIKFKSTLFNLHVGNLRLWFQQGADYLFTTRSPPPKKKKQAHLDTLVFFKTKNPVQKWMLVLALERKFADLLSLEQWFDMRTSWSAKRKRRHWVANAFIDRFSF